MNVQYLINKYSDGGSLTRGERFKDARKNSGATMAKIVQDTGVDKNKIYDLENDNNERDVGYKDIVALAQYYKVSLDWLLTGAGVPTANTTENYICQYTGLSESSIRFLHSNVEQALSPPVDHWTANLFSSVPGSQELIDAVNELRTNSAGRKVRWPIEVIEKLLSSEESTGILSDIYLFLTLSSRREESDPATISFGAPGTFFEEEIDGEIIAWGYLKRAENKLASLRRDATTNNEISFFP